MKGLRFAVVIAQTGVALVVGCGSTPVIPQVGLRSSVGTGNMATGSMCMLTTDVRLTVGDPTDRIVPDGAGESGGIVKFQCSVLCNVPTVDDGNGGKKCPGTYKISGRTEVLNAPVDKRGTFSISGTVNPKGMGPSPNMVVALTTQGETFSSSACTFDFVGLDKSGSTCTTQSRDPGDNSVICTANPNMGVDLGKVWGSVVCEQGMDSAANPPRTCKTAVTFRFENCVQTTM